MIDPAEANNPDFFVEEANKILEPKTRKANIDHLYQDVIPSLVGDTRDLTSILNTIHETVLDSADFTKLASVPGKITSAEELKKIATLRPGSMRNPKTSRLLNYDTTMHGVSFFNGKAFDIDMPTPKDEIVPEMMRLFESSFDKLIHAPNTNPDMSIKISTYLSHMLVMIHPFYEGNGRVARGLFTLAQLEQHQPPLRVESEVNKVKKATMDNSLNFIRDLYNLFPDCLPDYIIKRWNEGYPINVDDLLGIPEYAGDHEAVWQEKRQSVEKLIKKALEGSSLDMVDRLISQDEVDLYKGFRTLGQD